MLDRMDQAMISNPEDRQGWWIRWTVPVPVVVLAILIVTVFSVLAYVRQEQILDQQEADRIAAEVAVCRSSNEFRSFMGSYLSDQVGVPVEQVSGFEELDPETQALIRAFTPLLVADRQEDLDYAAQYIADFPIRDCSEIER
jgi:hypothetical protein